MVHPNGSNHYKWKGGKHYSRGYVMQLAPDHPRANNQGYLPEQYLVVEKIIGNTLPLAAVVHHVNGVRDDNRPENLVVCENESYHRFIHHRQSALKACGHAYLRKCTFCKDYDSPENLYISPHGQCCHRDCHNEYRRNLRRRGEIP